MIFKVEARQINYGYFEVEADSVSEAHAAIEDMIEDDFVREAAEWQLGEIETVGLRHG